MEQKNQTAFSEKVSYLTMKAHRWRSSRSMLSGGMHKGLDRIVYSMEGRYRRRLASARTLFGEAEKIADDSLRLRRLSEDDLRSRMQQLQASYRRQARGYENCLSDILSVICEISERALGLRPFPCQIMGALAIHQGYLAEMATGEGKSLTACLAAVPAVWTGRVCHVITANDYLAGRDASEMGPLYLFCGISPGWVGSSMELDERRLNYQKGVVYTTAKELLADFLRDRLAAGSRPSPWITPDSSVLRSLDTVIVDEADSLLIDEAVTPLIISRQGDDNRLLEAAQLAHGIAETLSASADYLRAGKERGIKLTKEGREKIETLSASLPAFWKAPERREELVTQALLAKEYYRRDEKYVIQGGKVVIVDEFTGRLMPDRTWNHGLHQAVEVREGIEMSAPAETLARLSFQRFFRLFRTMGGMTGTAWEAAEELWQIYGLPVLHVPTHRPCLRMQLSDRVFRDRRSKQNAIVADIVRWHATGRPVLVGTRSVEASNEIASLLADKGLTANVLNAVRHQEEAAIIARAGRIDTVTIATNMAGRGTDIKLGRGVRERGGLHVIATERHESGRIDRQLFGRCARQGDPGSCQAFNSVEDELFQRFLPGTIRKIFAAAVERQVPGLEHITYLAVCYAQRSAQRLAYRQRCHVLEMDNWLSESLDFAGPE